MQRLLIGLTLAFFLIACHGTRKLTTTSTSVNEVKLSRTDSLNLFIEAINLSEDMSRFSTKNDEILVLIYELRDALALDQYLFSKQLILDEKTRSNSVWLSSSRAVSNSMLVLFLIEQDVETPIEQIDPVIRVHYKQLIEAHQKRDYSTIEKYLGDEDLLGVETISKLSDDIPVQFKCVGIHKLDKFEYLIRIEK